MTKLSLVRAWGWDLPRLPAGLDTVVLTDDSEVAFVLGNAAGRGVLGAVDVATGQSLYGYEFTPFVEAAGRVVVSRASREGTVLAAFVDGDGAAVREVSLDDGSVRPVMTLPWRPTSVERIDGTRRLLVDGGVLADPAAGTFEADGVRRWRSRDLRFEAVEERRPRKDHPHVKLHFTAPEDVWSSNVTKGEGAAGAFSRDGRFFWRVGLSAWGWQSTEDYQERWDLAERRGEEVYRPPRGAWFAATRDDGGDPLVCGPGGVVNVACLADAARAGARWTAEAACVSPDGRRFGRVLDGLVRVTDLATGLASSYGGHAARVLSIAPAPDGAWVAAGGDDGDITVWDVATGEKRWHLEGGAGPVDDLTTSPDGRTLYALVQHAAREGRALLRAWDLRDGIELTPSPLEYASRSLVRVSPDGTRATVSQGAAGAVQAPVWVDLARWRDRPLRAVDVTGVPPKRGPGPMVTGTGRFSEDGSEVWVRCIVGLTRGDAWTAELDARDGAVKRARRAGDVRSMPMPRERGFPKEWYAGPDGDRGVVVVRRHGGTPVTVATGAPVTALGASADGARLFAGMADGGIAVWRVEED